MIRSMTGFARCEDQTVGRNLTWELRSVNHRYLEAYFRLPEDFRSLEPQLRAAVTASLNRGKLDCQLRFKGEDAVSAEFTVNEALITRVLEQAGAIAKSAGTELPINVMDVLRWPGVVQEPEWDKEPVFAASLKLFEKTLQELNEARGREGARIRDMLLQRCAAMSKLLKTVRKRLPEVRRHLTEKIRSRIEQLDVEVNQDRLEQELTFLAQKMDVAEELDRLESHLSEITAVVDRSEAVGRRLDFLMQELNREANTLASKSQDADTSAAAVDMKVLIEQMREQVQNVE